MTEQFICLDTNIWIFGLRRKGSPEDRLLKHLDSFQVKLPGRVEKELR